MMAGSLNRLRHFFNLVWPRGIKVDFMSHFIIFIYHAHIINFFSIIIIIIFVAKIRHHMAT